MECSQLHEINDHSLESYMKTIFNRKLCTADICSNGQLTQLHLILKLTQFKLICFKIFPFRNTTSSWFSHFDQEFTEGVIGAEYKNTLNNYMEHEKFSKPTVNSIKKHLKDVERLKGFEYFNKKNTKAKASL